MKKFIALSLTLGLATLLGACEPETQQPDTTDPGAPPAGEPTDPAAPPAEPGQ